MWVVKFNLYFGLVACFVQIFDLLDFAPLKPKLVGLDFAESSGIRYAIGA
jgi:hypothetical protein